MIERIKGKKEKWSIDPLAESIRILGGLEDRRFSVAGVVMAKDYVFPLIQDEIGFFCAGYGKDLKLGIPVQYDPLNPGRLVLETNGEPVSCLVCDCARLDFSLGASGQLLVDAGGTIKGVENPAAVLFDLRIRYGFVGNLYNLFPNGDSAFYLYSGLKKASEFRPGKRL